MVPNGKQESKTITAKVHFHFLQRNEGNFNDNHNSSILGSNGIAQVSVTFAKSNIIPDIHNFNIKMNNNNK